LTKRLDAFKAASGINGVAGLVGFAPKNLAYIVYGIPDDAKYSEFTIPKKSGGSRSISTPIPKLMHVQSRLAEHLAGCLKEIEIAENVKQSCVLSHGFKPNLSILTNATVHAGRRWVFNIDLSDFFPSINFGRVRGFFIKNKYFLLDAGTATLLAQIICHNNGLPQGAPTSPVVSNLISSNIDITLNRLAKRHRCTYTRYADDLTFSTNRREFSEEIGFPISAVNGAWLPGDELRYRVQRSGFAINPTKTRMQFRWSRQDVTGLIVNEKPNIPIEYVRSVRAMCDHIFKGKLPFKSVSKDKAVPPLVLSVAQVQGMLSHILRIKGQELEFRRPKDFKDAPSYLKTHRRFLDYFAFVAQETPTIVSEGETDNIYLRCALRALDAKYPNMISDDGKKDLRVRLLRYSRATDFAQGLAGGTGDMKELIHSYHRRRAPFNKKTTQPSILVVDNDQGSKQKNGVFAAVKNVAKLATVDGTSPFYHIVDNLYLVPTPLLKGAKDSMIESFLQPSVLKTVLKGKTLNLDEASFDPAKNYGKVIFAKSVVQKNAPKVDFSGYAPLLDAINAVIEDFKKKSAP
jgi:RNA-directed DNA polymerase